MNRGKRLFSLFISIVVLTAGVFVNINTLRISAASALTITGTGIAVRTGPAISYTLLGRTNAPDSYEIKGSQSDGTYTWYNVTYSGQNAWIPIEDASWGIVTAASTNTPGSSDFETQLAAFPESYKPALRALHAAYPNWVFKADKINRSFAEAVAEQEPNLRKQTQYPYYNYSRLSMASGNYDWNTAGYTTSNGGWYGASKEFIAYCMDPRNLLGSDTVFAFAEQSYDSSTQTTAGLQYIVQGTFLANGYSGGSYIDDITEAAKQSGVSPYIIASKIIQEQGVNGASSLISGTYSGYSGVYNFFNINASGANATAVITNGLNYAKSQGWTTRRASIIGGAKYYAANYIAAGQSTFYYMDFNVKNPSRIWHQYAQNVEDAISKGKSASKGYLSNTSLSVTFTIPVYNDMPAAACALPANTAAHNNYYITSMSVSGLTPSFSMYTYHYDLYMDGYKNITVKVPSGASVASASSYAIKKGNNTVVITVKAQSGYTNHYTINVNAAEDTVLTVNSSFIRGDCNLDGKITVSDLAIIQMHILGVKPITGSTYLSAADVNGDGKITISDLALVQMHLLGVKSLY